MSALVVAMLALLAAVMLYLYSKASTPSAVQHRTFSDPVHCTQILACNTFDGKRNLVSRMASRAIPNQRLVRAFDIDNAFTSKDDTHATLFKKEAARKISLDSEEWAAVAMWSSELVANSIKNPSGEHADTYLDRLVQSVALKIAIHVLFRVNPIRLDGGAITQLAQSINELWHLSKDSQGPIAARNLMKSRKLALERALIKLFPDHQLHFQPRDNPLNYILPAYETLWRVVLFCFVEVNFRGSHGAATGEWRQILKQMLSETSLGPFGTLESPHDEHSVSANDIINEALRLYTPTRRIHRMYHFQDSPEPEVLAADIEQLHRDINLWGEEPLIFKPSRWQHLGEEAHKAFMPFGNKPFICPAQKTFGPKIIGVLVAALVTKIDPDEWHLKYCKGDENEEKTLGDHELLQTDRKAYKAWKIYKKS